MNVTRLLIGQATRRPDAIAVHEAKHTISFAQLETRSARAAAMLKASGIGAGDAVLVFVPMSIELYVALIALFRVGAVATFLDPSAGREHIARCCASVPPAAMIAVSRAHLLRLTTPALRRIRRCFSVGWPVPGALRWERLDGFAPDTMICDRGDAEPALITFTSGSTGEPKGAARSHGFLAAQQAALAPAIELEADQVDLATLPIFTLANLASGVTSVIPDADLRRPAAVRAEPILRQIEVRRITRVVASPAFFERLLSSPHAATALASIDRVYTGGAPVFPGLLERLQRAMPRARVVALYGSTEAEPIAHVAWDEMSGDDVAAMLAGRGLLAGPAVPEVAMRIIDATWGEPLPPMTGEAFERRVRQVNEPGEIVVSGAHVLGGYLNGAGDSETKFRVDGRPWHRTGDIGYVDDRGRLWLLGRATARITDEHGTLYPFAVECAASGIPGLHRSALVQHAGRRLLVIEADDAVDPVRARSTLAWARLHEVRRIRHIPVDKRHNAKVDYAALRALL